MIVRETYLHVSKLGEGLVAVVELADIGLESLVRLFVRTDVAALSKSLSADSAAEGLLASVAAHVSLEVSALGKGKTTVVLGADL